MPDDGQGMFLRLSSCHWILYNILKHSLMRGLGELLLLLQLHSFPRERPKELWLGVISRRHAETPYKDVTRSGKSDEGFHHGFAAHTEY